MKKTLSASFIFFSFLFSGSQLPADLVYDFVEIELLDNGGAGTGHITGGTLTMVDGADTDGVLDNSEIVSAHVFYNFPGFGPGSGSYFWDQNLAHAELISGLSFVNNTLQGYFFIEQTPGEFIEYSVAGGQPGLISLVLPGDSIAAENWQSPFVVAQAQNVPEPGCAVLVLGLLTLLGCRRQKQIHSVFAR